MALLLSLTLAMAACGGGGDTGQPTGAPAASGSAGTSFLKVTDSGFTYLPNASPFNATAVGVLRNESSQVACGVTWQARYLDAAERPVNPNMEWVTGYINYILPSATQYLTGGASHERLTTPPASVEFRVVKVERYVAAGDPSGCVPAFGVDAASAFTFGGFRVHQGANTTTVVGSVTSHARMTLSMEPYAVAVNCGLYYSGKPVGSSFDQMVQMPPDTDVGYLDTVVRGIKADEVRCSADPNPRSPVEAASDPMNLAVGPVNLTSTSRQYIELTAPVTFRGKSFPTTVTTQFVLRDAADRILGSVHVDYSFPYLMPGQTRIAGSSVLMDWLDGTPAKAVAYAAAGDYIDAATLSQRFGYDPASANPLGVVAPHLETSYSTVYVVGSIENAGQASLIAFTHCTVYRGVIPFATYVVSSTTVGPGKSAPFKANNPSIATADVAGPARIACDANAISRA